MRKLWFIMALTATLSACSGLNVSSQDPPHFQAPPQQNYKGEMTSDLMYAIMLAEIAVRRGNLDVAVDAYLYAAEFSKDMDIAARATRLAIFAKRHKEALKTALIWEQAQPDNQELKHVLALLYLRNGDLDASQRNIDSIFARAKSPQSVFEQLSKVLAAEEDRAAVLELMGRLVKQYDKLPEAHLAYAKLALVANQYQATLTSLDRAASLRSNWWQVYELRSRVFVQQGQWPEAERALKKAIKLHPKDLHLGLRFARMLFQQGKYKQAKAQFTQILKQRPNDPDVLFPLGLLNMQQQRFDDAEQQFRQLVAMDQRVDDASYYLGLIAERDKRDEEAKQWYRNVRSGEHVYAAVRRFTLLNLEEQGLDATLEYLHRLSFESASDRMRLWQLEAEVLTAAKEYERAFAVYTKALDSYPDATELLYSRSILAERLNKPEVMEEDLQHILKLDPTNADAMNALGYTWADQNKHLQEAHKLIQRAHELKPDSGPILDSLGWVLFRLGRLKEAEDYLKRAYNLLRDGEVAAHLGEVYWLRGEKEKARKLWREAAKREPEHKILQQVMKKYLP
ncbi:MAG: tetratricopeptide repeat protein [Gammaproteobacteria bacterium]|nr:tetratricopeptide repeat protein [Gammaproteobacteria bacterium]